MTQEKMKIEFVKETRINGDVTYYTKVDDRYVTDSLSITEEKAKAIYDNIVRNRGTYLRVEVLDSIEI